MKNIQILVVLLLTVFCFSSNTFAQAKTEKEIVIIKKVIDEDGNETEEKVILKGDDAEKYMKENGMKMTKTETVKDGVKEMTIEVTAEGDGNEEITIIVDEEGNQKTLEGDRMIFIDGESEIPDEVRQMLLEKGINIDSLIEVGGTEVEMKETQKYKIVEIDDDGNKKVIEWEGDGEMPEEMKKLMEGHEGEHKMMKKKIMVIDDEDVDVDLDVEGKKKIIKIRKEKGGDQTEEIFEIDGDGALPQEVLDLLKEHGIDPADLEGKEKQRIRIEIEEEKGGLHEHKEDGANIFIKEMAPNKAQLGVMVEEDQGVKVIDFSENGAAKEAGVLINDLIVKVDKTEVTDIESLMSALADKEAGELVKLKVLRNGKSKKVKVKLKEAAAFDTSENYRTEHKVLKIESGDIVKCEPNDAKAQTESLSEEEIEIVEERIIEDTGVKQVTVYSGSNTLQVGDLDLFPNPTDGSIRVRFQIDNAAETKVQIINIAGRSLYEKNITDFSGLFDEEIDLSGKGMGTLVLVISQGEKAFTEKILLN